MARNLTQRALSPMRTHATLATLAVAWMVHAPAWAQPTCAITLGPDATVCAGQSATFTLPAGYPAYLWSTGFTGQSLTTGIAGTYWGQVSYPTGNLVNNGDFNSGNCCFWTQFTNNSDLQGEGRFFIGTDANNHHPQLQGTGNGNYLMVNAGFPQQWWYFWSQGVTVCPGQTYTFSFRMMNLATQGPATVELIADWSTPIAQWNAPAAQAVWNNYSTTITTGPNQTNIELGLRVISNWAVGNDFGIDDISLSGTVNLRDTVLLNVTPLPVVNLGPDLTLCAGDQATIDATTPGATYLWDDGSTGATRTISAAGTYSVDVTVNGCTGTDAVNVLVNPLPIVNLGPDLTLCAGDQATLDATTPGATYLWDDGSTGATRTISTAGTYSVDVTVNGCTGTDAVSVVVNPLPIVNLGPDLTLCPGTQGTLDATTPGATYLWDDGSTGATRTINAAGTYSVDVTVNGCTGSDAVNVTVGSVLNVNLGPDLTLCAGDQATLDATTPGATYLWDNGSTGPTRTVNATGTYSVAVTVNGCTGTDAVNVVVNPLPIVNLGPDLTLCAGDQATLDATTPGATYLWDDGSTGATRTINAAGTYSVAITVNGCTATDAVNVAVNPLPVVNLGPDQSICTGDQWTLNASCAGCSYLWDDGSTSATRTVDLAGVYSVIVTANGCSASDSFVLTVALAPVVDLGPDLGLCPGGSLLIDATVAGATYLWQDGSTGPTFSATAPGNYAVTVSLGSCSASDAIVLTALPAPSVDLGNDTTLCPGEALLLDLTGTGASVLWQDGSTAWTYNVIGAGTYTATVTGANGCTAQDAISVLVATPSAVDLGPDATLCAGSTLVLDATLPGANYLWSDGSTGPTLPATAGGTYWVQVSQGTCAVSDSITLTFLPMPIVALGPDLTVCDGTAATFDVTNPGASYLWQDGSTGASYSTTTAGTVVVTVTMGPCAASDTALVAVNPLPAVDLGPDVSLCEFEVLTLDATYPGATYLWQDGSTSPYFVAGTAGTYSVMVDLNGCTATDSMTLAVYPYPDVYLGEDTSLCAGTSLALAPAVGNATVLWSTGSSQPTLSITTSGTYWIEAVSNGCMATDTITATFIDLGTVDLGPDVSLCPGGAHTFTLNVPGATVTWPDGSTSTSWTTGTAGPVTVSVSLAGCTVQDSATVSMIPVPQDALGADAVLCAGDSLVLVAPSGLIGPTWSTGDHGDTLLAIQPGTYTLTGTFQGCPFNESITLSTVPDPVLELGRDVEACEGEQVVLEALASGNVLWSTGAEGASLAVNVPGLYWATVTGACGQISDTVRVVAGDCGPYIHVPNAFTPDNDGLNDVFAPSVVGNILQATLEVFDRWGERIVLREMPDLRWDGLVDGMPAPDGVYPWVLRYKALNRDGVRQERLLGHVTLLR